MNAQNEVEVVITFNPPLEVQAGETIIFSPVFPPVPDWVLEIDNTHRTAREVRYILSEMRTVQSPNRPQYE